MTIFTVDPLLYGATGGVLPWPTPSPRNQFAFLRDALDTAKSTAGIGHGVSVSEGSFDIRKYSTPTTIIQTINGKRVKVQTGWKLATNGANTLSRSSLSGLTIQGAGPLKTRITGNARLYTRQSDGTAPLNMTVKALSLEYTTGAQGYIFTSSTGSIPKPANPTITGFSLTDVSFVGRHEGNRGVNGTYMDITHSKDVLFNGISVDLDGQYGYNPATGEGGGFFLFCEGGQNNRVLNSVFREDGYSSSINFFAAPDVHINANTFLGAGLIKQDDGINPEYNPRGERFYNSSGSFSGNRLSSGSFFDFFFNVSNPGVTWQDYKSRNPSADGTFNIRTVVTGNDFDLLQGGYGILIRSDSLAPVVQKTIAIAGNVFRNGLAVCSELTTPSELVFGANSVNGVSFDQLRAGGRQDDVINSAPVEGISRWLSGGPGNDVLQGSTQGFDAFVFWAPLDGATNLDTIINFQNAASILPIASDQLWLDDDNFRSLATENGTLGATSFASNGGGTPTAAAAEITYDSNVGLLAYDPDGTGALGAVAFAKFEGNPLITSTDIRLF
jgi:hypothetical protein